MNVRISLLLFSVLIAPLGQTSFAELMFTYDDTPIENKNDIVENYFAGTFGYFFEVTSPVLVTGLAWYDYEGDGLTESHEVAIWGGDADVYNPTVTNPLISVTVPAGTSAPLEDGFRTASVETFELAPGIYSIGGFRTADGDGMYVGEIVTLIDVDPRFSYQFPLNTNPIDDPESQTALMRPTSGPTAFFGWMGPNITIVPEPSVILLAVAGFAALRLRRGAHHSR